MSDWMDDVKTEAPSPGFPSALHGAADPGLYHQLAEPHGDSGPSVSLPESQQAYNRTPGATPSERQRTIQACDKCRERKTKCSGEHPVCQRCTTRGLICQYSSREPRTRGPSKARLRNAVSTTDLRSSPKPRTCSHGAQPDASPNQLKHHPSQHDILPDYPSLRRVSSIPRSFHAETEHSSIHINDPFFEPMSETYMQPFRFDPYDSPTFPTPSSQYVQSNPQVSQWRDVRRVQSHSTLIGSSGGSLNRSTHFNYSAAHPVDDLQSSRTLAYAQWSSQGRITPPSMPVFNNFDHFVPPVGPLDPQMPQVLSPKVHPWGYHSDGSTGSESMSRGEPNEYSPSSSEDVPEPSSQPNLLGRYGLYDDPDTIMQSAPSQNGCTPQFHASPIFIPEEHYYHQGLQASIVRPASESNIHSNYQVVYP